MLSPNLLKNDDFLECDESSIDVESDLGDLDDHFCPVCKWSFRGRRPRMLRCGHAFYFCERCLKFKKTIRCCSCAVITELHKEHNRSDLSKDQGSAGSVGFLERHVVSLKAELDKKRSESMNQSVQNMEYIQKNRKLSRQVEELSQEQHAWRQKSEAFLEAEAEVRNLRLRNSELETQTELLRKQNEQIMANASHRNGMDASSLRQQYSPHASSNTELNELRKQIRELEMAERSSRMELNESRQVHAQSESLRQHNEREQQLSQAQLLNMKGVVQRRCIHMGESIRELRNEISFARKEMPRQVGKYGQWVAVEMSHMVEQFGHTEQKVRNVLAAYSRESKLRRKYFNVIQEIKGNIRVYCRIRPMLEQENGLTYEQEGLDPVAVRRGDEYSVKINTPNDPKRNKSFEYDRVFGPESTQEEVFEDTKELVTSVLDGFDVCIFAYGQTGSGKTFTMEGPPGNRGIYFRAIDELFAVIDARKEDYTYQLKMTMMEIYNERIRDLLNNVAVDSVDVGVQNKPVFLNLHERRDGTVFADGVTEWDASSIDVIHHALRNGAKNRSVGITNLNEHSSRSHSILTIEVLGQNKKTGEECLGKLNLIDLAGSERINRSGVRDQQLKEAQSINKSLSALGNVIESLKRKASHIPFRDSKLTFLLKNSLAGHSKTLMFVNVSPAIMDLDETVCSLNFASRARSTALGQASRNVRRQSGSPFSSPAPAASLSGSRSGRSSASRSNPRLKSAPPRPRTVSFVRG